MLHSAFPCIARFREELPVTISIRLFAVRGEEVGPPRPHIAGKVLYDDGEAVRFGVEGCEQILVAHLSDGPVGPIFKFAKFS